MSDKDTEEEEQEKEFRVDRAQSGKASCERCKGNISKGDLRIAKSGHNPFGSGMLKMWHHIPCMFETFKNQKATTKTFVGPADIEGWFDISEDDRNEIKNYFSSELKDIYDKYEATKYTEKVVECIKKNNKEAIKTEKDLSFKAFQQLCIDIASAESYNDRSLIIREFFTNGNPTVGFPGDITLWFRMLLPGSIIRNYNLEDRQLIKVFGKILDVKEEDMLEHLSRDDIAETISKFFETSTAHHPSSESTLSLKDVDDFLRYLSSMKKEDEQVNHFKKFIDKCTADDLKIVIRLIKHDLRTNITGKDIFDSLQVVGYAPLKNVTSTMEKLCCVTEPGSILQEMNIISKNMASNVKLTVPVLPMLAQACGSLEMAVKKFPNGIISEIKFDGERIQIHRQGDNIYCFNRNMTQIISEDVNKLKEDISLAFRRNYDFIIDGELVMMDSTGKLLSSKALQPEHRNSFTDAQPCLLIFDCLYFNKSSLTLSPLIKRKKILKKSLVQVRNRVLLSKHILVHTVEELEALMEKALELELEGLVLKDMRSSYEPGQRNWLKIKNQYLSGGEMTDSADLVVLGAWFGTGENENIMASFLMGCYDETNKIWRGTTKVGIGLSHDFLLELQTQLQMVQINQDPSKVPKWLMCRDSVVPDFVAKEPSLMPVWEIADTELNGEPIYTNSGISNRSWVVRIRRDKNWSSATNWSELKALYKSNIDTDDILMGDILKSLTGKKKNSDNGNEGDVSSTAKEPDKKDSPPNEIFEFDLDDIDADVVELLRANLRDIISKKPLPDLFTGCIIQMPFKYGDSFILKRFLLAYGAILYDSDQSDGLGVLNEKVTHVIHLGRTGVPTKEDYYADNVRHVYVNWIWDSIKLLERQNENTYIISCA